MSGINLLPHREIKRREAQQRFIFFVVIFAVIGALIGFFGQQAMSMRIDSQQARNQIFRDDIARLEQSIAEISRIRTEIENLKQRKQVIEDLQSARTATVHLLNALAIDMPEGMFLKSISQRGARITLSGYSQTNSRVSQLMDGLDASPYLSNPSLVEIKRSAYKNRPVSEFVLNIDLVRQTTAVKGEAQ